MVYGKTTRIELLNTKLGSMRILKVCAESGEPLAGATFLLYNARGNILGEHTTNARGIIELTESLEPQTLRLREIRSPRGYVPDDKTMHEIVIRGGSTTALTITNEPERGTIQIIKRAAEANDITKDRAGAALAGAVFEIINDKMEVVDTITTNERGIANSRPLPIGRYAIQEKTAPRFYIPDDTVFFADIRKHGDNVRFEVLNTPADIAVTVEKRGPDTAKTGEVIRYDFSNISNAGNTPLDEFYLRDQLPAEVRLETLNTGKWSERLTYRVEYRTNLKTDYRTWQNNLSTTRDYELAVADLKLAANEYVTEFRIVFGTVQPGFKATQAPFITARVVDDLKHETWIINRVDVGGRIGGEWTYDNDSWVTIAQSKPRGCLPRTGLITQ